MKRRAAPGDVIYTHHVENDEEGRTLFDLLCTRIAEQKVKRLRQAIQTGLVTINGRGARPGDELEPGDVIELREGGGEVEASAAKREAADTVTILHEDARCLVVDKPTGLPVLPTRTDLEARFLAAIESHLHERSPFREPGRTVKPRLVHRIDRDASGVLIVAKDRGAMRELTDQFMERTIEKRYVCLVGGEPDEDEGEVDAPILEINKRREKATVGEGGKAAVSHFTVLERFRGFAWVEVRPRTGRQHQIRLHMRHLGHPLAIDPMYGSDEPLYLSKLKPRYKRKRGAGEKPFLARLPLHAIGATFRPPGAAADERVTVEAPLPDDLEVALKILRRHLARRVVGAAYDDLVPPEVEDSSASDASDASLDPSDPPGAPA